MYSYYTYLNLFLTHSLFSKDTTPLEVMGFMPDSRLIDCLILKVLLGSYQVLYWLLSMCNDSVQMNSTGGLKIIFT